MYRALIEATMSSGFQARKRVGTMIHTFSWCYRREYCSDLGVVALFASASQAARAGNQDESNRNERETRRRDQTIETYQRDDRTTESSYTKDERSDGIRATDASRYGGEEPPQDDPLIPYATPRTAYGLLRVLEV